MPFLPSFVSLLPPFFDGCPVANLYVFSVCSLPVFILPKNILISPSNVLFLPSRIFYIFLSFRILNFPLHSSPPTVGPLRSHVPLSSTLRSLARPRLLAALSARARVLVGFPLFPYFEFPDPFESAYRWASLGLLRSHAPLSFSPRAPWRTRDCLLLALLALALLSERHTACGICPSFLGPEATISMSSLVACRNLPPLLPSTTLKFGI